MICAELVMTSLSHHLRRAEAGSRPSPHSTVPLLSDAECDRSLPTSGIPTVTSSLDNDVISPAGNHHATSTADKRTFLSACVVCFYTKETLQRKVLLTLQVS